jgi:imidazolonepropionase-like amidohydrolase
MSKPSTVCARVFLAGALSLVIQNAAIADTVIVTADRMIDVIGGRVVDHPQVTITDGRISAVGNANAAAPAGARQVNLTGMTLLPGLIDMHTHIG